MKSFMKKKIIYAVFAAVATAALVSCTKEQNTPEEPTIPGMKTITITTGIQTKTTLDAGHENLGWSTGDQISVFNNVNSTNSPLTYSAGESMTVTVPSGTTEIYGHYPYYSGNESGPTSVSVYINKNQTQTNPGELAGNYYPMVAKGTVTDGDKANMIFYPVASALALNIYHTGVVGTEKVSKVVVTPTANTYYIGGQATDITGSGIKYTTTTSTEPITVTLTNALTLGSTKPANPQTFNGQIYVCLAKQSYTSVQFAITTNKGVYTITSNTTPFDCVNNDFVPVNINLNKASFRTLEDGDYVILSKEDESYYAVSADANASSERRDLVSYTYSGSASTSTGNSKLIWTVTRSGDNYTIQNLGKYLSSGSNTAPLSDDSYNCVVEFGAASNGYIVKNNDSSRNFKRNGSYGFGFYTSAVEELYFVPVTFTGNPIINVSDTPISFAYNDTATKYLDCSPFFYTSVSAAAYSASNTSSAASTWLTASYSAGKISYSANSSNGTGVARTAYIIVTATNANGTTESSAISVTQNIEGVATYTIFNENFGTNSSASATALSSYTGYSEATIHPTTSGNWKVSKSSVSNNGTYTGCSGGSYMTTGTSGDIATLVLGDISDYSNVVLSFGYSNNASTKKDRSISVHISANGGTTWSENIVDIANNSQAWQLSTHDIDDAYLSNFAIKFTQSAGNTTSIDDIKITGQK